MSTSRRLTRRALSLCTALATAGTLAGVAPAAQAVIVANPVTHSAAGAEVSLRPIGTYESGVLAESAAEIVAFHAASKRILTVNAQAGVIDVLDASDPTNLTKVTSIAAGAGQEINSVAVRKDGLAVAAVQQATKTDAGEALFFNAATGEVLGTVQVGAQPDNVHITADGAYALLANEGEPSDDPLVDGDYAADPVGSVSVITLPTDVAAAGQDAVRTADFTAFDAAPVAGARVFGPENHKATASVDFEPEYISSASGKAYVSLQEANAIAIIDIASATVDKVVPAHVADHSQVEMDSSNKDDAATLRRLPVKGLSMPDSVGAFTAGGATYFATANEGDAREWGGYVEEAEIGELADAGKLCDNFGPELANKTVAGKLKVSTASGWNEDKQCYDELYSFGSRSFSIYDAEGNVVFDSGATFEQITAMLHAEGKLLHNADNEEAEFDDRSDNKGPEPEALTIGVIGERTYAFIGAERVGGIFVYDVTDPHNATFETYINNRDFSQTELTAAAGDLGPEGFTFVDKADSPNGKYLLIVGNEVSGTTTVYEVEDLAAEETPATSTPATTTPETSTPATTTPASASGSAKGGSSAPQRLLFEGATIGLGIGAAVMAAYLGAIAMVPQVRPILLSILPAQMRADVENLLARRGM